jgi:hypothetical protein
MPRRFKKIEKTIEKIIGKSEIESNGIFFITIYDSNTTLSRS